MAASSPPVATWSERAMAAEAAMIARHLRPVWGLPGTSLGLIRWPPTAGQRAFHSQWHYWWQAQLVDCAIDAFERAGGEKRAATVRALVRGLCLRNVRAGGEKRAAKIRELVRGLYLRSVGHWTNEFYDDTAWLGLALERAQRAGVAAYPTGLAAINAQLLSGWTDHGGGGIWWRMESTSKNVQTNGPAAIFHARFGPLERARELARWMTERLVDPSTGLVLEGLHVSLETGNSWLTDYDRCIFTYCQGVYIGTCVELWRLDRDAAWIDRATRVIAAVQRHLTLSNGAVRGHGGGDGGLFTGILMRYLAQAALHLPPGTGRDTARRLVFASATGAWALRASVDGLPLFGADWSVPAVVPAGSKPWRDPATRGTDYHERDLSVPLSGWIALARPPRQGNERDLSVQLSGWIALEAAALLERSS